MSKRWRRCFSAGILAFVALASGIMLSTPAHATEYLVQSGSLTMTSDPGDHVGNGQSYAYSVDPDDDAWRISTAEEGPWLHASIEEANGEWWAVTFAAPSGQVLAPGVYTGAGKYLENAPGQPGMNISGNSRICGEPILTGSFTITDLVLGPHGYVQSLDATFEQHCGGGDPALRGRIQIENSPPPAQLELGLTVADEGTVNVSTGEATLRGTLTCTVPVDVFVISEAVQRVRSFEVSGYFYLYLSCTPGSPVPWEATAAGYPHALFQSGDVEVHTGASAWDPTYGTALESSLDSVVRLSNARGPNR